jgi:chitodextrinase
MMRRGGWRRTRIVLLVGAVQAIGGIVLAPPPLLAQSCDAARPALQAPWATPIASRPPFPSACAPGRFTLEASDASPTAVALRWSAVAGASAYTVTWEYADPLPAAGGPPLAGPFAEPPRASLARPPRLLSRSPHQRVAGPFAVTELTIGGLDAGTAYRFVVEAVGASGAWLATSAPAQLMLPTVPPNRLTASADASGVTLSWNPVPDAATYRVLAASGPGALRPDPERADLTTTATRIDGLPPASYTFQVEARDPAGGSLTRSNLVQASVGPNGTKLEQPPSAAPGPGPLSFRLTATPKGPQAVELEWPMLRGAGTFAVYQAQGDTPLAFAFATGMHRTTLTGLVPGTTYTFQVRARDAADVEFGVSNSVSVSPDQ